MNNNNILISFIIIILVAGSSGCITSLYHESYHEIYYKIDLEYLGNTELYLPIPYNYPNEGYMILTNESKIVEDLRIAEGNGEFELINTEKGPAIKVNFTNSICLVAKRRFNDMYDEDYNNYFFNGMTLEVNNSLRSYYFYSNCSNVEINSFVCYFDRVGTRDSDTLKWEIEGQMLKSGWNSLELE